MAVDSETDSQLLKQIASQLSIIVENVKSLKDDIAELRIDMNTRVGKLEQDFSAFQSSVADIINQQSVTDTHEVLISGIPPSVNIENGEIVHKILSKLHLPNLSPFVLKVRDWTRCSTNKTASASIVKHKVSSPRSDRVQNCVLDRNSSRSKLAHAQDRAIVVKFASVPARDELVANSVKLKSLNANKIFEIGGSSQISIRTLWPKPLYELWRAAANVAVKQNFAKPIIRNLTVFMRETPKSALISIRNTSDLAFIQRCV